MVLPDLERNNQEPQRRFKLMQGGAAGSPSRSSGGLISWYGDGRKSGEAITVAAAGLRFFEGFQHSLIPAGWARRLALDTFRQPGVEHRVELLTLPRKHQGLVSR